jgi:hypothetical protein
MGKRILRISNIFIVQLTSIDIKTNKPYSHEYSLNEKFSGNESITLGFILNHFTAILPTSKNFKLAKPHFNQFYNNFHELFE